MTQKRLPLALSWLAGILTLLGAVYFLNRLLYFADVNRSILDEGLYLYKGFLYASGRYFPFQDYGPVTIRCRSLSSSPAGYR